MSTHKVRTGSRLSFLGAALRSPARGPAAVVLLVVAAVHVPVTPEHLEEATYIGVLFIALSVVCVALSGLLVIGDSRSVWLASAVVNLLAIAAYVVSRCIALPRIGDDVGNWTEPLGMAALLAELVSIAIAASVLLGRVPRRWKLWTTVAVTLVFAAGCSTATGGEGHMDTHTMADGSTMAGSAMPHSSTSPPSMETGPGPSRAAQMICSDEIRKAVERSFDLVDPPASSSTWADRVYGCTYRLPQGMLRLSVYDATDEARGTTHFAQVRSELDGAEDIGGLQNFGFPAFQSADGNVVFLKDGKTLRVDASELPASAFRSGYSAEQAAYSVAAAVIACWTE